MKKWAHCGTIVCVTGAFKRETYDKNHSRHFLHHILPLITHISSLFIKSIEKNLAYHKETHKSCCWSEMKGDLASQRKKEYFIADSVHFSTSDDFFKENLGYWPTLHFIYFQNLNPFSRTKTSHWSQMLIPRVNMTFYQNSGEVALERCFCVRNRRLGLNWPLKSSNTRRRRNVRTWNVKLILWVAYIIHAWFRCMMLSIMTIIFMLCWNCE